MTIVLGLKIVLFWVGILANILLYIAIISGKSPITAFNHFSFIGMLNEQYKPIKFFYPLAALADLILIYVALFICTIVFLILVIVLVILSMPFIVLLIK
ncbi:hypothetical protein A3H26_02280 [candidate division WWE3 bacterium RIFCSPLOWO2_12_FULL_36_10]|uniref:Uncharacterized protein n=1 Tax=candidate division WWE3 bacterium RIFCSPLOWO2_12_FULL_36_10 TaxID=1802630 RepID=A0A1F4VG04_UNCKA|nr:MAG: hypothetical protein A3H26_02280 [candidate division WWE3 bacterium RIFCSPLOWO2_12_FULL_36_10]